MTAIIGVDCATDPNKVGLALGRITGQRPRLLAARAANRAEPPAEIIADWLREEAVALLALDAPLGWPAPLGRALLSKSQLIFITFFCCRIFVCYFPT